MDTLIQPHHKKTMEFINQIVNKKALNNLLAQVYLEYGGSKAATLANSLKNLSSIQLPLSSALNPILSASQGKNN